MEPENNNRRTKIREQQPPNKNPTTAAWRQYIPKYESKVVGFLFGGCCSRVQFSIPFTRIGYLGWLRVTMNFVKTAALTALSGRCIFWCSSYQLLSQPFHEPQQKLVQMVLISEQQSYSNPFTQLWQRRTCGSEQSQNTLSAAFV